MQQQFQNSFIKPFHQANYHYLVAVSGGVDSVVLCHLLKEANLSFAIAHCNFSLRGEESTRDENFVKNLAIELNVPFYITHFDTQNIATKNKLSIQVTARNLRYEWFAALQKQLEKKNEKCFLLTAHHANDAIETSLYNYFRGTGIEGLTGISFLDKERKIVRPLLAFPKSTLLQYAQQNNIEFVEDSSNQVNKYKRNFIRNKLLPILKEEFPSIEQSLIQNLQRMQDVEEIYAQSIASLKNKLVVKEKSLHKVAVLLLQKQKPLQTIVWEIFKDYNFSTAQIPEIIKLLSATNTASIKSNTHRVIKNRNWLLITKLQPSENSFFVVENEGSFAFKTITFTCIIKETFSLEAAKKLPANKVWLDADLVQFPLIIRSPRMGDYFYPLGMNKKKKLSRFFIDQKCSLQQKETALVVESNKKIVWLIGYRINERCKLTENSKKVLMLKYE
jgi:tRNA(Ile)-lysidine synthase